MWTLLISILQAGWTPSVEHGQASPALLSDLGAAVEHCPHAQSEWIARYQDGALLRVAPIAGAQADDGALASCLEAGLKQRPLPGTVLLRLRWQTPQAEAWEERALMPLNQALGPVPPGGCTTLRYPINAQGTLGLPTLVQSSGDPERDQRVLATAPLAQSHLPPLPDALQAIYGESVDLCVQGIPIP